MTPIRVLVVDDHPIVRQGIESLISIEADMSVVGVASTGNDSMAIHGRLEPDITIMDLTLPDMDGIDAMVAIRRGCPHARFLMLTASHRQQDVLRAIKAGANGYVFKSGAATLLLGAIRSICGGKSYFPPDVVTQAFGAVAANDLTARELQVLKRIAVGDDNAAIAVALRIDPGTVKNHVHHILSKLGARTRTHAVAVALQQGLVHAPDA